MDILNINLNLLKSFWAVYKTGGINKGAKYLGLATPVVAYNIKQLERQLDQKMFTTHKKGVDPTGEASALFALVDGAFESLLKYNERLNTAAGTIRLGILTMHASYFLVDFMQSFRAKYPGIRLEFFHHPQHDYLGMLENKEIDVAIYSPFEKCPTEQMHTFRLLQHPMVFFTSKKFAAQHDIKNEITINQLTKLPIVIPSLMKSKTFLVAIENFYNTQFKTIETPSTHSAYEMTINGKGICYFFEEYLDAQNNDQIVKLALSDAPQPPTRFYDCSYTKKPSALVSLFVDELKNFYSL
jgi:DNA-binding transcriptional LysR family regulator